MPKFIYLISLNKHILDKKINSDLVIKTLDIADLLTKYLDILDEIYNLNKQEFLYNIKCKYCIKRKEKLEKAITKIISNNVTRKDYIILSKEIIRSKYIMKIEFLLGKKYILYKSNSILHSSTIFAFAKEYNRVCILTNNILDYGLIEEYIKFFKVVDIFQSKRIIKNEKKLEILNNKYGCNNCIIYNEDLYHYDLVINIDLDISKIEKFKFKKSAIFIDNYNIIEKNEIENIEIDKNISRYYTRESKEFVSLNEPLLEEYNLSYIEYVISLDKY